MATKKVTHLHEYYMTCGQCDGDVWYIKMTQDASEIDGILCGNPECNNFVENPGLTFEVELD